MKDLITKEYNGVEVHFEIIDGESYVAIEDVARFCGWIQIKNGKEYIRYERINEKLSLLSFPNVGENDYIPEKVFYPLVGMADFTKNLQARKFMLWVGEVIAEIRQTGSYSLKPKTDTDGAKSQIDLLTVTSKLLNLNDSSKLLLATKIYKDYNIPTAYLPTYTDSREVLKSATELLKENNISISTIKFNKIMIDKGYLIEVERTSGKDKSKIKKFKNLVKTEFGENQISPKNPKETQPMYYENKFLELLKELGIC